MGGAADRARQRAGRRRARHARPAGALDRTTCRLARAGAPPFGSDAPVSERTARAPDRRASMSSSPRGRGVSLIGALCLVVTVAYGGLYYGFAVLITEPAAGGEF